MVVHRQILKFNEGELFVTKEGTRRISKKTFKYFLRGMYLWKSLARDCEHLREWFVIRKIRGL